MSRLTKYLESLMGKKDSLKQAETTSSVYYFIDGVQIRVSDHFSTNLASDISIINPLNQSTTYLVQVKEGPQILQFSLKDLKVFISNYCYVRKIASLNREVKSAQQNRAMNLKAQVKLEKKEVEGAMVKALVSNAKTFNEALLEAQSKAKTKKQKNLTYLLSRLPFTSDGLTWLEITTHLSKLFPKYATISKGCKGVLKEHLYNRSTQDIKEVMTYLFDNGKFDDSDKLEYYFLHEETKGE